MVWSTESIDVGGTAIEVGRGGSGRPVIVLHGEDGTLYAQPFLEALAAHRTVIVPQLPGWGGSGRPGYVKSVPDIADLFLELVDVLGAGQPVPLVGLSLGGWVAAELAVRCSHGVSGLVLAAPLGIKVGDRESRDFLDLYAHPAETIQAALFAHPSRARALADHSDDDFLYLAQAQEAVARYAWEPYLHDPKLAPRLRRIAPPALVVSGDQDGFVLQDHYFDTYAELIGGNARRLVLSGVGHRTEEEAPDQLSAAVLEFLGQIDARDLVATHGGN